MSQGCEFWRRDVFYRHWMLGYQSKRGATRPAGSRQSPGGTPHTAMEMRPQRNFKSHSSGVLPLYHLDLLLAHFASMLRTYTRSLEQYLPLSRRLHNEQIKVTNVADVCVAGLCTVRGDVLNQLQAAADGRACWMYDLRSCIG